MRKITFFLTDMKNFFRITFIKISLIFITAMGLFGGFTWRHLRKKGINDWMFLLNDVPLYKHNSIMGKDGQKFHSSDIAPMFFYFETLKKNEKNYLEMFTKRYLLDEASLDIFDKNIITLDDGYRIHSFFSQKEGNKKLLVFIHGIVMTIFRDSYTGLLPHSIRRYFQDEFDILVPEFPGSTINPYVNDEENFEKMLDVCAKWVKKNYSGKEILLIGHSFGCWLTLGLAKRLEDENISIILNNPFYDSQTAMAWTLPVSKKLTYSLTKKRYSNDERLKDLGAKNIFILATPKDPICPYTDALKLKEQYGFIKFVNICADSRGFIYKYHAHVNFEQNFWLAQHLHDDQYLFTEEAYDVFKQQFVTQL